MPSNNICLNSNPPQFASMTAWMMSAISILKISSSPGLLAGKKNHKPTPTIDEKS